MIVKVNWNGQTIDIEDDYLNVGFILDVSNAGSEKDAMNLTFNFLKDAIKTPNFNLRKLKVKDFKGLYEQIIKDVVANSVN
jgi:hypothetical protein